MTLKQGAAAAAAVVNTRDKGLNKVRVPLDARAGKSSARFLI
jgi:hypothetical protein